MTVGCGRVDDFSDPVDQSQVGQACRREELREGQFGGQSSMDGE